MENNLNILKIIQMTRIGPDCSLLFIAQNQLRIKIKNLTQEQALNRYFQFRSNQHQGQYKRNWTYDQIQFLIYITDKVCFHLQKSLEALNQQQWATIAESFRTRTGLDCMFKMLSLKKYKISAFPWDSRENQIFIQLVQQYENQWDKISKQLYLKNDRKVFRNSKACKQHYACFLNPNIKKGHWTRQEDYKLALLYTQLGRKWSKIANQIQGRNQNSIKNRFFLMFESKMQKKTKNQVQLDQKVKKLIQKYELEKKQLQICSEKNQQKNAITIDESMPQKQEKVVRPDKEKQEYSNYLHYEAMNFLCDFDESSYRNCLQI